MGNDANHENIQYRSRRPGSRRHSESHYETIVRVIVMNLLIKQITTLGTNHQCINALNTISMYHVIAISNLVYGATVSL